MYNFYYIRLMGEFIMATQIENPLSSSFEKTLIQHTVLAEKFLALFKNMIIGNITPSLAQDDIAKVT